MIIRANTRGIGKIMAQLGKIENMVYPVVAEELARGALDIHSAAVKSIASHVSQGPRVRRFYSDRKPKWVRPSLPGNPPNTDRGTLVKSIQFSVDTRKLIATVGTQLDYGIILETAKSAKFRRPWLHPAFDKHKGRIHDNIFAAMKNMIKKRGA